MNTRRAKGGPELRGRVGGGHRPEPEGKLPLGLLVCTALLAPGALPSSADGGTIAVFSEPGFPFYIASSAVTPEFVVYCLREAGVTCETVDADGLSDPATLDAERFVGLVHVYGNTFPVAAAGNLRRYHQAGGCIIAVGGVPYCHPCVKEGDVWRDRIEELGFDFCGHRGIGTGYWGDAQDVDTLALSRGEPFGLGHLPLLSAPPGDLQFPRIDSVADTVIPAVSALKGGAIVGHPVCAVEHHCPEFSGAVDVWLGATLAPQWTLQQYEQLITAGCVYVLQTKGKLTDADRARILQTTASRYVAPSTARVPSEGPFLTRLAPPADELAVLDVSALPVDEGLLAASLQGVVNRGQPRIFLVNMLTDLHWLELLRVEGARTQAVRDVGELLDRYRGELEGAVVYDPAEPHQVNLATTVAGARDVVLATAELAQRFSLPVVEDLRGRFTGVVEGYEWALNTYWDRLDHRVVACQHPSWVAPRDYIIASRAFTFWLDADVAPGIPADQHLFFERVLARMPLHGYVLGWWQHGDGGIGEYQGVLDSSRYAKITVCTVGAENLSVHSGLAMPTELKQKPIEFGDVGDQVYISFLVSDGDNFGMDLYAIIERFWHDEMRGKVPIGWGLCPTQVELSPLAIRHWYETATENDLFVCMDGLGYVYPAYYGQALGDGEALYGEFLDRTSRYMEWLDLRHLWFLDGTSRASQMARQLRLDGLFGEYGVLPTQRQEVIDGTAAIWVDVNPWEKPYDTVDAYVSAIRKRRPDRRPAFLLVGVNGFCIEPNKVAEILRELGPGYIAVRPDELCHLMRAYAADGVAPQPRPRPPLDLSGIPNGVPEPTREDGWLVFREARGEPDTGSWFTAPGGTEWVRKRMTVALPADADEAMVRLMVSGPEGRKVQVEVNGHVHEASLPTFGWQWLSVPIPVSDLVDGENDIRYTGNPDGRLNTAGYSGTDLDHSDFGSEAAWASLDGELACIVDVR